MSRKKNHNASGGTYKNTRIRKKMHYPALVFLAGISAFIFVILLSAAF